MNYNPEFSVCYTPVNTLKSKTASMVQSMMACSRLNNFIQFEGYAFMTFNEDDSKHIFPNIEMQDKFNRLRTNCMVYNVLSNQYNIDYYDKLFIYHDNGHKDGHFHFAFYNTKTNALSHTTWLPDEIDTLAQNVMRVLNVLRNAIKFDYYGKVYDATKGIERDRENGLIGPDEKVNRYCPTITDMKKMFDYYDNLDRNYYEFGLSGIK